MRRGLTIVAWLIGAGALAHQAVIVPLVRRAHAETVEEGVEGAAMPGSEIPGFVLVDSASDHCLTGAGVEDL